MGCIPAFCCSYLSASARVGFLIIVLTKLYTNTALYLILTTNIHNDSLQKVDISLKSIMILTFYLAFAITMALIFPLNSDSVSSNIKIQYSYAQESGENQTTFSNNNDSSNISKLALPKLFSQVRNSVVQVSFTADIDAPGLRTGLGSGFVYDDSGHILSRDTDCKLESCYQNCN